VLASYGNQYRQDAPAALQSNAGGASCRYWLVEALLASLDLPLNSSLANIGRYWLGTYARTVSKLCQFVNVCRVILYSIYYLCIFVFQDSQLIKL